MKVRGVVHVHSNYSHDGVLPLSELKKQLFSHGVSFCCITEDAKEMTPTTAAAFVDECHQLSDQAFVFIPGFEVLYQGAQLLLIGTSVFRGAQIDESELLSWREVTPLMFLARGAAVGKDIDDALLALLDGIEVWNQNCDGSWAPDFESLATLRQLQVHKPELRAIGGLGLYAPVRTFLPELELEIDTLEASEVVRQIGLGFYAIVSGKTALGSNGTFVTGGGPATCLKSHASRFVLRTQRLMKTLVGKR